MPRYIEPFEILEMVGTVAYRLALRSCLSGVHEVFHVFMLRKYTPDLANVVNWGGGGGGGEGLMLIQTGPLRRDRSVSWIAGIRFCDARP